MNFYAGLTVFVVVWWMVLFMVLPWGVRPLDAADVERGHASGAPAYPRMLRKLLITTGISCVIWGLIYLIVDMNLISFR